jgi:NADPH:quinone reductase-like Zn-dependent oxidoreductase
MRAVVLTGYGDVNKLVLRDVPEPSPASGQIKVRVAASSVNPIDWKLRSGVYRERTPLTFPVILGRDAAGEVIAVGDGVRRFRVGSQVVGLVHHGYAEYVVDEEDAWTELPPGLDLVDAAALPLVVLTGAQLIDEAVQPRAGSLILVTGAVGSVGRAAVFAARLRGAKVLAGVRQKQEATAARLGVDVVALDDVQALDRLPPLDAIADTVDGETLQRLLAKVKAGGTVGSTLGEPAGAKERGLRVHAESAHPDPVRLARLVQAAAAGELVIPIAKRMPLEQIRAAQTLAEKGAGGKVVLLVR